MTAVIVGAACECGHVVPVSSIAFSRSGIVCLTAPRLEHFRTTVVSRAIAGDRTADATLAGHF